MKDFLVARGYAVDFAIRKVRLLAEIKYIVFVIPKTPDKNKTFKPKSFHLRQPLFQVLALERRLSGSASRTMAAMSLGFIVMATPWTIQEVVAACTGSKVPPFLDFIVTWTAISNSFWNPFLYWLLNAHFRRISRELLSSRVRC